MSSLNTDSLNLNANDTVRDTLSNAYSGPQTVLLSTRLQWINKENNIQKRVLMMTNKALYLFKEKRIKSFKSRYIYQYYTIYRDLQSLINATDNPKMITIISSAHVFIFIIDDQWMMNKMIQLLEQHYNTATKQKLERHSMSTINIMNRLR